MDEFEVECAPFQCALSTRAGTDCVGHMLRAAMDADPRVTILTVDVIGAYDHVLRLAVLGRLASMPGARSLLPFVRMSYAQPSSYQTKEVHTWRPKPQEQGDPLMPLLFSIGGGSVFAPRRTTVRVLGRSVFVVRPQPSEVPL